MNTVNVRKVEIGKGIPKICVPVVGITRDDIIDAACKAKETADLVEWRADWYEDVLDFKKTEKMMEELRETLGDIPLLFTFRTLKEGGEKEIEKSVYVKLNEMAVKTGFADLVDAEAFTGTDEVNTIVETAHLYGVKVIASNHDFQKTPPKEEIVSRLCFMQECGADIVKIAVMPQSKKDVLTLAEKYKVPFLTYSAEMLNEVEEVSSASSFVKKITGIDNVCERAAVTYCKKHCEYFELIAGKSIETAMTAAIARRNI